MERNCLCNPLSWRVVHDHNNPKINLQERADFKKRSKQIRKPTFHHLTHVLMNLALNPYLPRYSNKQASPQICHHPRNITRSIPSKTQKSSLSPHPEVITDLRFLPFEQRDFCFLSRNQHFYMYVPLGVVCSFFGEKL